MKKPVSFKSILMAAALFLSGLMLQAQTIAVRGVVMDKDGQPVIGASVIQKDAPANGAITAMDGRFSMNAPQGAVLVVSSIGFADQEITAAPQVNVVLQEGNELLNEVVVVGYGVQRKTNLTGAISSLKSEDIQGRAIANLEQALQGKTPGVTLITTSAQPGAVPTVRVRGIASNGTSDPLYVVDGLLMDDISSIDPNSIESMEVLKDAASAAIYGAQAGNGVILITTKRGAKGVGSVSYDFQYQISSLAIKPRVINAQENIKQTMEANPSVTDDAVLAIIDQGIWDGRSSTDWLDVAFGRGVTKRHTVNLQGANDKGSFYVSLGAHDENGIVRQDKDTYKRYSVAVNADYSVKPWLKVGTTADFAWYQATPMVDGNALNGSGVRNPNLFSQAMYQAPYIADTYAPDALTRNMQIILDQGVYRMFTDENGNYYSIDGLLHPMVAIKSAERRNYGSRLSGTLFANFTPFKGFVFTSRLGYKVYGDHSYYNIHNYYGGENYFNDDESLTVSRTNNSTTYYQWENFANYNISLGKNNFGVTAGMSFSRNSLLHDMIMISSVAKDDPLFADIDYASGTATRTTEGRELVNTKLSYFGRLNYNYAEKYLFEATFRADAADLSVLPLGHRWGYFPSVSAGWVVSNEDFFSPLKNVVSFLKVRGSWGQNGSTSNLSDYPYSNSINVFGPGYSFSGSQIVYQSTFMPAQLYNPDLKWETSEQLDFGVDIRLLRDRFTLTADWFRKDTKDLIIQGVKVPFEAGNVSAPVNGGNIRNQGVEVEVGWKDQVGDFFYSLSGNLATLKNKVTWLNPNVSDSRIMSDTNIQQLGSLSAFEEGYPVWYFRGFQLEKIDETTGDPVLKNVDGDKLGVIDENDKTMIGKPLPDLTYGLTLQLGWKGVDLTVFANGTAGNDMFLCYNNALVFYSLKELYDQRWTPTNTHTRFARPQTATDYTKKYMLSDTYVFDGSYFRIRQVQLGYTLPQKLTRRIFVERLRLYASLDNYFLFTKYPGLDPEISTNAVDAIGLDFGAYPTTKKMLFGVSVTF